VSLVLGIGELVWDLLPDGPRLGGAPLNAVAHLRRLGAEAAFLCAVGDDELGRQALTEVGRLGLRTELVEIRPDAPTGTVAVELDAGGHPAYRIHSPAAYERHDGGVVATAADAGLLPDAVVLGTLAQAFPEIRAATRALAAAFPEAMRVFDVNLRDGRWTAALVDELLHETTLLKLNDDEVSRLGRALDLPWSDPPEFMRAVASRYGIGTVCVTRGGRGAIALSDGAITSVAGIPVAVVDTVGAGDAFTAGFVWSLLREGAIGDALRTGNALGALVASREGAIPEWTSEGLGELIASGPPAIS
jgi:fructokinase